MATAEPYDPTESPEIELSADARAAVGAAPAAVSGIALGDKVVLLFSDNQRRISARLIEGNNDLEKGEPDSAD